MIFAVEPLSQCWNEGIALARAHWNETEGYRHNQTFNPVFERYNQYDRAGWYFQATARVDGEMVGYFGVYVVPSMHTQELIATEDTFFVLPEYRKGRHAIRFYKFVEEECRKRGAVSIEMTAKMTNRSGRILDYMGYTVTSQQYTKNLVRADSTSDMKENDVCRIAATAA